NQSCATSFRSQRWSLSPCFEENAGQSIAPSGYFRACRVLNPIAMSRFTVSGNVRRAAFYLLRNPSRNCSCLEVNKNSLYDRAASNTISHHAQIAWKRLSQLCSYGGPALPPIGRIAGAITLALNRSNLVAPGVIAFVIGEFAWMQRSWAEADYIPTRAIYLASLFSPCIAMAPFVDFLGVKYRKTWLHIVHHTLERAGPAFIKWGQWAATRSDLFARDLCSELAKLHTKAPAHSFLFSKKSIETAFGRKLPEIFETFEEEHVASGSVAQVHQATLKYRYPGQQIKSVVVAVKVRHPGVGEAIRIDFRIINCVAKIAKFIPTLKWLRLDESIQQFAVFMMSQVDLSREAAHLSRFINNFRRWKDVSFPRPLHPLVHPSVLVETYEQGESVMHYVDELEGQQQIKSALAHIGSLALLKMLLFIDGLIEMLEFLVDYFMKLIGYRKWKNLSNFGILRKLLEQVRQHKVNIDGNACTVMVTTLVLEGWQQKLDPEYDVMRTLKALLFKVDWAESLSYTIEGLMAP
ncbi:UbiB domain containing protein, partial [Parasponia andersonii]